jgi:peroxin-5
VHIGKNSEAILAFEAHLQKNISDANAWRIVGRLHQENDQDEKAVAAFLVF